MMKNKSLFSFEENIIKREIIFVLKNDEDILEGCFKKSISKL